MTFRTLTVVVAAASLGLVGACTEPEQDRAEAETRETGQQVEAGARDAAVQAREAASTAGEVVADEATRVGAAVATGVSEAATEFDQATDRWAADAQAKRAEREAEPRPERAE